MYPDRHIQKSKFVLRIQKWGPLCADKLLRKKGPCQELERTKNGILLPR